MTRKKNNLHNQSPHMPNSSNQAKKSKTSTRPKRTLGKAKQMAPQNGSAPPRQHNNHPNHPAHKHHTPTKGPTSGHSLPPRPVNSGNYNGDSKKSPQVFRFGAGVDAYRPPQGSNGDNYRSSHAANGDSYRPGHAPPQGRREYSPHQDTRDRVTFSFRSDQQGPKFVPPGPRNDNHIRRRNDHRRNHDDHRSFRRPRAFPPTSDRAIFQTIRQREPTPDRLDGMGEGTVRFKSLDEVSQSMSEDSEDEAPQKRQKLAEEELPEKPKWSNPDPYTALPPTFERAKRVDVVQLIRKAKITLDFENKSTNAIADNDDFVPFSFVDDNVDSVKEPTRINLDPTEGADVLPVHDSEISVTSYTSRPGGSMSNPIVLASQDTVNDSRKRKRPAKAAAGSIKPEWIGSTSHATPWISRPFQDTNDMYWRLHEEILDFYHWIKPRPHEQRVRQYLVNRIHNALRRTYRDHRILSFGSFASGLYLPMGDMDLVLVSRSFEERGISSFPRMTYKNMYSVLQELVRDKVTHHASASIVAKAKVPIVKFVDNQTGLDVDISFENLTGVVANKTYRDWINEFPDLPMLIVIVKQFLLMRGLNEVFIGGIGGFSITCLIVSYLQLQCGNQQHGPTPARNLGELLIGFFEFFGRKFDMINDGISLNPPKFFPKEPKVNRAGVPLYEEKWCIIDPNNPDNDVSAGTRLAPQIARCFAEAADVLLDEMDLLKASNSESVRCNRSLLGSVLGGNYASVAKHRERMLDLDEHYAATMR